MKRNKIDQESYQNIGKMEYDFDFQKEKLFYSNLCFQKMKKKSRTQYQKNLKELNENKGEKDKYTLITYSDWKRYILNKYDSKEYSKDKLINFSAYLNIGCRNWGTSYEWKNILSSVTITVVFTALLGFAKMEEIEKLNILISQLGEKIYIRALILEAVVLVLFIIVIATFILWIMTRSTYNDKLIQNMYEDYKKIIDELIENKKKYHK